MDFGDAIRALKQGKRVTRKGWNGKGMYLFLATATRMVFGDDSSVALRYPVQPSICMRTAQEMICVGWLASQTDMLAEDWEVCA